MDFGALYNGYHADMTRTLLIGPATSKHHEIYNTVLEAQLNGIKLLKQGYHVQRLIKPVEALLNTRAMETYLPILLAMGLA